mmetsp:Transcript_17026/g.27358  ORF Transcript_17026/g.27358 Transcript_17026/m.27358 type:complete len:434 (+) Transcript_17026:43-1344(+)
MAVASEENTTDKEKEDPVALQLSPSLVRESLIVFDWDDTILPTSWLERIRALTAGVPVRPEVQRQMATLSAVCATTLSMAQQMGTLVFITNSAPGWVDQSCQLFMPQIHQQVRGIQIFAKPMHAPLTFKLSAFRRECQAFRNLVSVGDGDAERAASLRLLTPPDRKITGRGDTTDPAKCVKSVKLIEFPSCQQLIAEHEMLQVRLLDIVNFQGCLDLKARFGAGVGSPASQARGNCSLVHFARPLAGAGQITPPQRTAQSASLPSRPNGEDGGTMASGKMQQGLMMLRSNVGNGFKTPPLGGLPPLGSKGNDSVDYANAAAQLVGRGREDRGNIAGSPADVPTEAPVSAGTSSQEFGSDSRQDRDVTPTRTNALWKIQGIGDPRLAARAQYQTPTKKRPVLPSSSDAITGVRANRGNAVWREGSAPAAPRGGS